MNPKAIQDWTKDYLAAHRRALEALDTSKVAQLVALARETWLQDRQMFAFGNGGSAANASHFATDLGKGASDRMSRAFRILSLNDNVSWLTALGNDYSFDDVFVRQLANYGRAGDLVLVMSVSGNSPNLVKAVEWSNEHGLKTIALTGGKRGRLAEIAQEAVVIADEHYGRVEDLHMTICHLLCYAFVELPELRADAAAV
jgi:D-sedoheptulose 7-phosphate isomerase